VGQAGFLLNSAFEVYAMAMALVGYVGSMAAALAILVVLLNSFIIPSSLRTARQQPHPVLPIAQSATPEKVARPESKIGQWGPPVAPGMASVPTTEDAEGVRMQKPLRVNTKEYKRARLAELRQRKLIAHQNRETEYSAALGYQQETTYDWRRSPSRRPPY
jgi:hypothetical protein